MCTLFSGKSNTTTKWIFGHFSEDSLLNSQKMLIPEITVEIISPNTHTLLDKECRFPKKIERPLLEVIQVIRDNSRPSRDFKVKEKRKYFVTLLELHLRL